MPEVVVVSGWSTFASQAATAWCRLHHVPYVLLVESNERDPRPGWRRAVKAVVVPPIVRGAAEVLVVGRLARESMLRGASSPSGSRCSLDTVDAAEFGAEADRLRTHRDDLRADAGLAPEDVAVLSIARLAPEKAPDTLVRAVAAAADPRLVLVLAGSGSERGRLDALAAELGVRLVFLPDIPRGRIVERFAIADVFALLSRHEPGRRRERGGRVRPAARRLRSRRRGVRPGRRRPQRVDRPRRRPGGRGRGDPHARDRPGAPPRRRGVTRARARLGLRAEHREPPPRRARVAGRWRTGRPGSEGSDRQRLW